MLVSLLCPGPSLFKTYTAGAGKVIAINRSALWYAADIWAANDYPLVSAMHEQVKGKPNLWTNWSTLESLQSAGLFSDGHAFRDIPCPVSQWSLFTAPAALVVAQHLGATRIDVHGADWTDAPDADGERPPSCRRDADRWQHERRIWDAVCSWLAIPVNRIHAEPA